MHPNLKAFLDMIAWSELGPQIIAESDRGYNVLVGSLPGKVNCFRSYSDHPRQHVRINYRLVSTAAGRYQILGWIFDHYKEVLRLPDFSPASQDKIAIRLIRECKAYNDIIAGRITEAIHKCRSRWASLPGANYGQHEHRIEPLLIAYRNAGGSYDNDRNAGEDGAILG